MKSFKKKRLTGLLALSLSAIFAISGCAAGAPEASKTEASGAASTASTASAAATESSEGGKIDFTDAKEAGAGNEALADIDLNAAEGFKQGGTLKISGYFDPPPALSGNQYLTTAGFPGNMKDFTFLKLFDYVPLPNKVYLPMLGESFTQEGNKMTIKLDPKYKWSDGTPVTSKDVVCTFNMKYIFSDQVWKYLDDIKAVDDYTVELTWKVSGQYLLVMASSFFIDSPYSAYGKWADKAEEYKSKRSFNEGKGELENSKEINDALIAIREDVFKFTPDVTTVLTNHMYKVVSVNASDMTAERNEFYPYADKVAFDKIILQRYVSIEAWLSTVMAGGYDIEPHGTTPDLFKQLEDNNPEMKTMWTPDLGQASFQFNLQKYPMNIPEVRKAIVYAIDQAQLLPIAEPGTNPGDQYITGLTPKWRDVFLTDDIKSQLTDYTYDPAKGEELLKSIGWTKDGGTWKNEKGEVVEIEVSAMNSWPIYLICGDAVTNMLKDFGFNTKFNAMELSAYWTYIDNGEAMISADFRGGGHTFGYWEAYKNLYLDANNRIGYLSAEERDKNPDAPILVKDAAGSEIDMRSLISKMFSAADNEGAKDAVISAMKATNELVPFIPFGEKWSPIKIHNPKLTGYPEDSKNDPLWYCAADSKGMARLIRYGKLFYKD